MKIPVHVNYPGTKLPEAGMFYVVGREGMMLHLENDWIEATVPLKEFQVLDPVKTEARLKLPPIDALVFAQAVAFFKKVYDLHKTEAAVLLHYSRTLGWRFSIPKQKIAAASVKYDMLERLDGYRCVGTMHSHANMSAFHSGVDVRDEAYFDGVHITIGDLANFPKFSMSAEVVFRGTRFKYAEDIAHGVSRAPTEVAKDESKPDWWKSWFDSRASRELFVIDPRALERWEVPAEWLAQVKVYSWLRSETAMNKITAVQGAASGTVTMTEVPAKEEAWKLKT